MFFWLCIVGGIWSPRTERRWREGLLFEDVDDMTLIGGLLLSKLSDVIITTS